MGKTLVLGAGGMLGHKLCQRLSGHEVVGVVRRSPAAYREYGDVFEGVDLIGNVDVLAGDALEATLREQAPRTVINGIGLVKQLDEAEDPYLAVAINALLPHRLARICSEIGARLIHISTDCVFTGDRGSYRESDPSDARDLYGRSKALGETTPRETAAVTLRTSFIGRELEPPGHGLVEWFLSQEGGRVNGFTRVVYSGLTSLELVNVLQRIVDGPEELKGVYNVASQPITKYDLLKLVREVYGLDLEIRRADKPVLDRSLAPARFREATGYTAPPWTEMIQQMREDPTPYGTWSP